MNINFRKYLIILLGALFLNSCSLLTRSGISNTSKIYYSDDVNFYYDLTYRKDNKVNYERQIWEKAYKMLDESQDFFLKNLWFDTLAGTDELRKQIIAGKSETEIRNSWKQDLQNFEKIRTKYRIYQD